MKYIRIKNSGHIQPQALHLVGASTKVNDKTKIGQFGSGNKYALAYFLRNGYDVKVYAGETEIKIETKEEVFRENTFNVIYIDGERTSITTQMGKDWKFWQAIREVYCNALDEGGAQMDFVMNVQPQDGETHFYIDTKKDVTEFVENFDNYFAQKKEVLFESEYGRILRKSGTKANIYRKGIRCFESNKTSAFDYDLPEIGIDENRLVRYFWHVEEAVWNLIYSCDNEEIILQVLHNSANHEYLEGCLSDVSTITTEGLSEAFKNVIKKTRLAPKSFAGLLKADEVHQHIIVPTKIFQSVRGVLNDENVGDNFKIHDKGSIYREIEMTALYDKTLKDALYFLKEAGFEIPYPVKAVLFDSKEVLGAAHMGEQSILISDICFEKGVNTLVNVLIEEFIHLKYEVQDETRAFQDAMLTEFISYMKKVNSFAI